MLMKIRISDMVDCSAEILTRENSGEQCNSDKIRKLVFERLEIKKKRAHKQYIASFAIACVLGGCVSAGLILGPGGKITNQVAFESETGLIERESDKDNQTSIGSDFIDDQFLYDALGNPIAKYVLEINTNYEEDELYIDNGTMLILHNDGKGIKAEKNIEINLMIEQSNMIGNSGTVEVGYIYNRRPYYIATNSQQETTVTIKGGEGEEYYPYFKNISSDRVILKIKYERE